jgi:hypothetical protein
MQMPIVARVSSGSESVPEMKWVTSMDHNRSTASNSWVIQEP